MANHKSSLKRLRQNLVQKLKNRYYYKSMRTAVKNLRNETDKLIGLKKLVKAFSMLDKLVKKNIIHRNKAANLKSSLSKLVNNL